MADSPKDKDTTAAASAPKAQGFEIKNVKTVSLPGQQLSIVAAPDADLVFAGGHTGEITAVDMAAEKPQPKAWDAHVSFVTGLVLTDKHLVSSGSDHQMIWWDRESRERVRTIPQSKWVRHLTLSPDGRLIALCGNLCGDSSTINQSEALIQVYDWQSGKLTSELRGGNFFYERVRFHHEHKWLLGMGGAGKGSMTLIDRDGQKVAEANRKSVTCDMWLSKNSDVCLTAGWDGLSKWSISSPS